MGKFKIQGMIILLHKQLAEAVGGTQPCNHHLSTVSERTTMHKIRLVSFDADLAQTQNYVITSFVGTLML